MTFEELQSTLPNGLHDAQIEAISRNFRDKTISMSVAILVGLPSDNDDEKDRYRNGTILFRNVEAMISEVPTSDRAFRAAGNVWFVVSQRVNESPIDDLLERCSPGTRGYSLYVLDWDSYIHIAAQDLHFSWGELPSKS